MMIDIENIRESLNDALYILDQDSKMRFMTVYEKRRNDKVLEILNRISEELNLK